VGTGIRRLETVALLEVGARNGEEQGPCELRNGAQFALLILEGSPRSTKPSRKQLEATSEASSTFPW